MTLRLVDDDVWIACRKWNACRICVRIVDEAVLAIEVGGDSDQPIHSVVRRVDAGRVIRDSHLLNCVSRFTRDAIDALGTRAPVTQQLSEVGSADGAVGVEVGGAGAGGDILHA